jgi:hypothetical protein
MQVPTKPTIFISSTIYDFRDLRSALKYWLEQLGYEVMLSEFNDFTKPLDENSYTACLKAIERASHFILLIGGRTGGMYDAAEKVSITRMEYRAAYDLVKAGRMKLITFVREDLWNVREDRKALRTLLINEHAKEKELSDAQVAEITNHPSTFVNHAEATFSFLHEVGRIDEMKRAIVNKVSLPVGNWIHPFSTFEDITVTLSTVLNTRRNLSTVALLANLKRELLLNLAHLTQKGKDKKITFKTYWGDLARRSYKGGINDSSNMPIRYLKWLAIYLMFKCSADSLSTQFLDQALTSGAFLEYDFDLNTYKGGMIHNALFQLKGNINRMKFFSEGAIYDRLIAFSSRYVPVNNPSVNTDINVTVSNEDLMTPLACYDCEQNVAMLCMAIVKALDGDTKLLASLKLNPSSPSADEAEKIEAERTTIDDVVTWLDEAVSE